MDQIKFTLDNSSSLKALKEKYLNQIKENKYTLNFIEDNNLNDEVIKDNASKFLKCINSFNICSKCKNPNDCQSTIKHCAYTLTLINNEIQNEQVHCKKTQLMYELMPYFLYHDFDDNCFNLKFNDLFNQDYKTSRKDLISPLTNIIKNNTSTGVYLYGNHLIGKSFILGVTSVRYVYQNKKQVAFASTPEVIKELNDIHFVNNDTFTKKLDSLINVDLLVLDDFGKEYKNEYIRDTIIVPLLLERLKNHRLTLFTSTYDLKDIQIMYSLKDKQSPQGKEVVSLIESLSEVIHLNSLAYRE